MDPALNCPLRGLPYSFPLAIDDAGVRCQEKIKKLKPEH
jgi:hypothetical protein